MARRAAPRRIIRRAKSAAQKAAEEAQKAAEKAHTLMTPAAGASVVAGALVGSVLGARVAASEKLTPNQTAAAMVGTGATAAYLGFRYNSPIAFGGGIGVATAGVNLAASHQASKAILAQPGSKSPPKRNAMLLEEDLDEDDVLDEIEPLMD